MLKKIFISTQTFWALWENPDTWNFSGNLKCYAAQHFGADDKGWNKKIVAHCPSGCSLPPKHEREYVGENNIRSSCEDEAHLF